MSDSKKTNRVKNPLRKRLFRELKQDFGKYVVVFTFIFATIAMVSGFLVSDISLKTAYDESFETYNVEDGHFTLYMPAEEGFFDGMEKEYKVKVYENFYADFETGDGNTLRMYRMRKDVNRADLWEGEYPRTMSELAIDRLYAENNGISIGDFITVNGRRFKVTGFVALTDYSALFKNNTDMMFDANKFTVALVSDIDFDAIQNKDLKFCYSWVNNDRTLSGEECSDKAEDVMYWLAERAVITDFLKREDTPCSMSRWSSWRSSSPSPLPTPSRRKPPSSAHCALRATAAGNCCGTTSPCPSLFRSSPRSWEISSATRC